MLGSGDVVRFLGYIGTITFVSCILSAPVRGANVKNWSKQLQRFDFSDIEDIKEILISQTLEEEAGLERIIEESFSRSAPSFNRDGKKLNSYTDLYFDTLLVSDRILADAVSISTESLQNLTILVKFIALSDNLTEHQIHLDIFKNILLDATKRIHKSAQHLLESVDRSFTEEMEKCMEETLCKQVMTKGYDLSSTISLVDETKSPIRWKEIIESLSNGSERITEVIFRFMRVVKDYILEREDFLDDHLIVDK